MTNIQLPVIFPLFREPCIFCHTAAELFTFSGDGGSQIFFHATNPQSQAVILNISAVVFLEASVLYPWEIFPGSPEQNKPS